MGQNYDNGISCPKCRNHENVHEQMPEARDRRAFYCGLCHLKFDVRLPTMSFRCDRCSAILLSHGNLIEKANTEGWDWSLGDNMHFFCPACAEKERGEKSE